MKKRALWGSVGMLVLLVGLAAHGAEAPADAKVLPLGEAGTPWADLKPGVRGGTFHMASFGNPQKWNPITAIETGTTVITNHLYHGLVTLNPLCAAVEPALAKSWEVSDDGCVITFRLRRDLRWSDGEPLTSADVVFTFNDLILNPDVLSTARDSLLLPDGTFPRVEAIDDLTVRVTTPMPFRPLLLSMGKRLLPRHKWAHTVRTQNPDAESGAFNTALGLDTAPADVVGSGPYVLQEFVADQYVILARNPYYYVYDAQGTQLPYYDRRVIHIVADADLALLQFLNRELDALDPRASDLAVLAARAASEGFTLRVDPEVPMYGSAWLSFNQDIGLREGRDEVKRALYRDAGFRQAFARLVDKGAMIEAVFHGLAVPQWSPVSLGSPFYAGRGGYGGDITGVSPTDLSYDMVLAMRGLDDLSVVDRDGDGWRDLPDGSPLEIRLSTAAGLSEYENECLIIADRARLAGLDVRFEPLETSLMLDRLFSGAFDAAVLGFTGGIDPNSLAGVYAPCGRLHFWHLSGCQEPTQTETELVSLFARGTATLDVNEAFGIYQTLQSLAARDAGLIYTVYPAFRYAYYAHVGNGEMANPNGHPTGENALAADLVFDTRLAP